MSYEKERCKGCDFYPEIHGGNCLHPEMENDSKWPHPTTRCDLFEPSLECRMAMALEEIVIQLKTGPSRAAVILVNDKGELQFPRGPR